MEVNQWSPIAILSTEQRNCISSSMRSTLYTHGMSLSFKERFSCWRNKTRSCRYIDQHRRNALIRTTTTRAIANHEDESFIGGCPTRRSCQRRYDHLDSQREGGSREGTGSNSGRTSRVCLSALGDTKRANTARTHHLTILTTLFQLLYH